MNRRLLLIGWDAADWKIISPLVDAGRMPHLESLIARGVMGNLSTIYPVLSPMLWTSIATGKRAWKHGIHGFIEPRPDGMGVQPISGSSRETKAIWNILNQEGKQCHVIGWWPSHPVEPLNGVAVSNLFQRAPSGLNDPWPMQQGTVHPPRLAPSLAELRIHPWEIEGDQLLPFVPRAAEVDQQQDSRLMAVAKTLAECSSVHAAALSVINSEPWDFMAVYYDAIDHFCHGFMKYHPPRLDWIPEDDFEVYREVVQAGYCYHDLMLGVLLQMIDDQTTVMVISDHGFHSDHLRPREYSNQPAGPADEHREHGIFVMAGPGILRDELVFGAGLLDVTPTILTAFGLPVGRDMDGRPLISVFRDTPQVEWIDSWDDKPGDDGRWTRTHAPNVINERETLRQLADLGYIDSPEEDQQTAVDVAIRELRFNLARAWRGANRLPEALEILEELWAEWRFEHRFGVQAFDICLALRRVAQAREIFEEIVSRKAEQIPLATQELAGALEAIDGLEENQIRDDSRREIRRLQRQASANPHTLSWLEGRLLAAEGDHHGALDCFHRADEVQTYNHASLAIARAESQFALRNWRTAEAEYRRAMKLDPTNAAARLGLAQTFLPQRRFEAALTEATACVGLDYNQPRAHYLCGLTLYYLGRAEDALASLTVALQQRAVFPRAHRLLSRIYSAGPLKNPQLAAQHAAQVVEARRRIREFEAGVRQQDRSTRSVDPAAVAGLGSLGSPRDWPEFDADNSIIVVSGLPRSGTSMMMQMLEMGGMPLLTDDRRPADVNNSRGYQEFEPVKYLMRDRAWLPQARGKAVKIVAPLIQYLEPDLDYRVIFMERPLSEIIASQRRMLDRMGKRGSHRSAADLATAYETHVEKVRELLRSNKQVAALSVAYSDVLADPGSIARAINEFLGGRMDETAMATAVHPSLRTQTL